jgi:integrase
VADLDIGNLQLQAGLLVFYRTKINQWDRHELTPDTLRAAHAYLTKDRPGAHHSEPLFVGKCSKARINVRSVRSRVQWLGLHKLALPNLSPHDGRHFVSADALENGTTIDRLQAFGGWSTATRPLEYAKRRAMGNKGVKLSATRKYEQQSEQE